MGHRRVGSRRGGRTSEGRIAEEKAEARWQAVLDMEARNKAEAEEAVAESDDRLPSKQKERAEG